MNRRAVAFWAGLALVLVAVGWLTGGRSSSGIPLDPDSTDPLGTRALMIFLDEFGATTTRGLPDQSTTTALMLADQLSPEQRVDLDDWIASGGTLVVTDPGSGFSPDTAPVVESSGSLDSGDCSIPGLDGLRLQAATFLLYPNDGRAPGGRCFGDQGSSHVQIVDVGDGRIINVGGAIAFTNQNLDEADNAVLAARLIFEGEPPQGAGTQVAVLFEAVATPGSRSFGDLIPSAAKWATWQLLVAFGLYVLWKAPRFGRPVPEPQPVELPGSLLVRATGELHRRSGAHGEASTALRGHLDRRLRRQLRVSPELPVPELVEVAASGHGVDPSTLGRALTGPPAQTGPELADLVADIDHVNDLVLSDQPRSDEHQADVNGDQT